MLFILKLKIIKSHDRLVFRKNNCNILVFERNNDNNKNVKFNIGNNSIEFIKKSKN